MKQNQSLRVRKAIAVLALFFSFLCYLQPESVKADTQGFYLENEEGILYIGGTIGNQQPFGIHVPDGMVEVRELTGMDNEFLVRYGTDCPKVCGVTEDGMIVAARSGEALVTAVLEFSDGTSYVFTRQITVKQAEVVFTQFLERMKVGEKILFQIELRGYDQASIKWMTAKRGGAVVGKNYGKTEVVITGYSSKEDTIKLYVGSVIITHKIKVE